MENYGSGHYSKVSVVVRDTDKKLFNICNVCEHLICVCHATNLYCRYLSYYTKEVFSYAKQYCMKLWSFGGLNNNLKLIIYVN